MKSLSTKKIIIAILSVLFAFCMMAGLTANKVSANTDLETVTLKTTMDQGAQMRLTNPTGMRFITVVDEEDLTKFNSENVTVVTMITQKNLLDDANIDVADFNKDSAVKMAKVEFNKYNLEDAKRAHEGVIKLTATILEISDSNIAKTYVAKTYITNGEKIGYVGGATEASIYNVATKALKDETAEYDEYELGILAGYTKSCTVTLEGTDQTEKVPYGVKISDLVYGMPECYVLALKDLDGNPVALDAVVTTDLVMSMSFNHSYKDGKCEHCRIDCVHVWENGTCTVCGTVCSHEWNGITCGICGNTISSVYNSATDLSTLIAYGYSQTTIWEGNTSGLYFGAVTEVDGKSGNFFSVHFAHDGNGVGKQYVGISIAPSVTLAQLNALKDAGYNKLSVDYYFRHQGGAMTTYKNVYAGSVYTYGQALTGTKEQKALGEWHTFTVSIDDIIANYDGLVNGTKYLMHVQNSRDEGDNAHNSTDGYGHFKAFFGNMQFIVELNTTYHSATSTEGVKVGNYDYNGGVTASNYQTGTEEIDGKSYFRVRLISDANGFPARFASFNFAPQLELSAIQQLKATGYTKLAIKLYIKPYNSSVTTRWVNCGIYEFADGSYHADARKETLSVNTWQTIEISIDDIIANYDGLKDGSKYLFQFINNNDYAETGDYSYIAFDSLVFVK